MNIFDLLESPRMGRPHDTTGVQSSADQSAASVIGSGTTKREAKKKPVRMMGAAVKEDIELAEGTPVNMNALMARGDRATGPWWARAGDLNYMGSTESNKTLQYKLYFPDMFSSRALTMFDDNKDKLLKAAREHHMEQDDNGEWFYPVYRKTEATKHEISALKYMFGEKIIKKAADEVEEAAVKPNFKMPPESLQDKMYRQHQELRKQRGAPSAEEYKQRIAQKQAEIDALKEGILDRAAPKMPKPRNPADQVLQTKVNAGGRHLDKKRRQELAPKHKHKDPLAESLRPGEHHTWTVHFADGTSQQVNVPSDEFDVRAYFAKRDKQVVKVDKNYAIQGQQQDQARPDNYDDRADRATKAHIRHDRGLTEQEIEEEFRLGKKLGTRRDRFKSLRKHKDGILGEVEQSQTVKITDYDLWLDEVKALGAEIHPQKDRNVLVAQSWDGEEIGKFHLGKEYGFINHRGMMEDSLNEFAPGGGESGRWYTDDDMADIVGNGWLQDLDISGDVSKQEIINEAQAWLLDQGYKVQVLNVKVNDDDCDWYIEGSFHNPRFAKKGVDEGWKGKLAGAALAGAAALGGGDVDAQNIDLPGPQSVMIAHIYAEVNDREVNRTVNLGTQYQSEEQAKQDLEEYMQSKGITRYTINIEQKYDQSGGYRQGRSGSGYATGPTATGPVYAPGLGDMIANRIGQEIRAGIPSKGGYATGGTNKGQRERDGSQWWRDRLPQIMKEEPLEEDIERHLLQMRRAGYDIVQEEWSDKYKSSINCSNPKGFSQKAHCAGKKKNEDVSEEKVRLDPKCWTGKKIGNPKTKIKGGVRVNNCVPK